MNDVVRILLIEDDPTSQKIFKVAVSKLGVEEGKIEQQTASGVASAISVIQSGFKPDIVFLDWKLQGETGEAFLEWVRQQKDPDWVRFLTIHVLSSSSSKADVRAALKAPQMANAYFVKPSKIADLTGIISLSLKVSENTQKI